MDQPYWSSRSFHPNAPPSPRSSSLAPSLPYQDAVPAPRVQQQQQQQQQQNIARQLHAHIHPTVLQNRIPSVELRKAVTILKELSNPTIFTWLKGFRSFFRGEQGFDPSQLPPQQCWAVSALVGYPDGLILTWLNNARSSGILNTPRTSYGASNLSCGTAAPDSFAQSPSYFSGPSIHSTPRGPWYQESQNLSRDASVGLQSSEATSNDHDRWCYLCEHHPLFTTRNGLKRHMREHYTTYYCVPPDSIKHTKDGPICIFCGVLNPDPRHLNTHNDHRCDNKKYTRKENLIAHLEDKHGMRNGSVLAKQSKYTVDQKYFACGFCVFWCNSLNELVNHIDGRHYKYLEHICDWKEDNVIRGLLSQPVVDEYWRSVRAANPHLQQSWFMWDPTHAKQLRHRLEMSREPAHILFQAVIEKSNYGMSQYGHGELVPVTGSMEEGMDTSHLTQTFQCGIVLSPLPSTIEQGLAAPQMTAPTLHSQHLAQGWDGPNYSDLNTIYDGQPPPQIASGAYNSPASTMYHPADHLTRPNVLQNNGESFTQHQRPPYVFPNAPASYTSQTPEGPAGMLHYSTLDGHSPSASRDVAAPPGSRQVVETRPLPAQAHAGWSRPTLPTQSTSAPSSSHRPASPLGHLNSPHHPTLGLHISSRETRDSSGTDTDSDFDDQLRFLQNQSRSRRRRRNRGILI